MREKKPSLKRFKEALKQANGHLSNTAKILGVDRVSVYYWRKQDKEFDDAVKDARGGMLDTLLSTSYVIALGIPNKDEKGRITGWIERPDPNMLKFLISKLGREEGFGDTPPPEENHIPINSTKGIEIDSWIKKEIQGE